MKLLLSSDALALVQNGGGLPALQLFVVLAGFCKALTAAWHDARLKSCPHTCPLPLCPQPR